MRDPGRSSSSDALDSPGSPGPFGTTDQQLNAELSRWTGATPALGPVGELLDRHWEAAFAYARLCTDGPHPAGMLTTASFTRLFGQALRQSGPGAAWRPHLLLTVRRIAAEWSADHRWEMLHPDLRREAATGAGAADRIAGRLLPRADRRLLSQAFHRLPQTARALLWHAEVEAEPLAAPARLLGLDEEDARIGLRRAAERLREECLQAHRDSAPEQDCLRYVRLLDVTWRRGGVEVDPDLAAHLAGCAHCRHTADQLAQFGDDLGTALAESVLGWGARTYRELRLSSAERPAGDDPGAAPLPRGGEPFASFPATTPPPSARPVPPAPFVPPVPTAPPLPPAPQRPAEALDGAAAFDAFRPPPAPSGAGAPGAAPAGPRSARRPRGAAPVPSAPDQAGAEQDDDTLPLTEGRPRRRARGAAAPGRSGQNPDAAPGRRAAARGSGHRAAGPAVRPRTLALAAAVSGLVVLPVVLWTVHGPGDGASPHPGGQPSGSPGRSAGTTPPPSSWTSGGTPGKTTARGRLTDAASGLCVGITGGHAVQGAETEMQHCSSAPGQQWAYETDGLMRSGAAPGLCLDSHLGYSVLLARCVEASAPGGRNVRYDFTLQGTLVPRFDQDLALTPAATDGGGALVLKTRAAGDLQRWRIDPTSPTPRTDVADWDADHGRASGGRLGR
ncbi:ricin-type beta-trefoil lectin domain protein [Streptomyces sp. NPDC046985]|uniref:ricin-type beta-trefoil lectin domain protein n=1 Tax=Streptomyces sp. NPDC046985 TaxID=3155377 RepID=UPI0033DAEA90